MFIDHQVDDQGIAITKISGNLVLDTLQESKVTLLSIVANSEVKGMVLHCSEFSDEKEYDL